MPQTKPSGTVFSHKVGTELMGCGEVVRSFHRNSSYGLVPKPAGKEAKDIARLDITRGGLCPLLCRMVRAPCPGILRVGSTGGEGASRNQPATGRGAEAAVPGARADPLIGAWCNLVAWLQQGAGKMGSLLQRFRASSSLTFLHSAEPQNGNQIQPSIHAPRAFPQVLSLCYFLWWDLWPLRDLTLHKHWCGK